MGVVEGDMAMIKSKEVRGSSWELGGEEKRRMEGKTTKRDS